MPRTYVDNAYNRSVGRVGMTHGTAVVSSNSGYGGGGSSYRSGGGGGGSSSSGRTYVDNSLNRSLGRVGLPHGSAVVSSNSGCYGGGEDFYTSGRSSSSSGGTYVDNSLNRSLGRVGLPHGSAVHSTTSRNEPSSPSPLTLDSFNFNASDSRSKTNNTYVDNPYNRRLGRVGKVYGTTTSSTTTSAFTPFSGGRRRCYVDNPMNRKLGRVGLLVGTAPVASYSARPIKKAPVDAIFTPLVNFDPEEANLCDIRNQLLQVRKAEPNLVRQMRAEAAIGVVNRHDAALASDRQGISALRGSAPPNWVRGGEVIRFEDIDLGDKIGGGGFGDVHVGFWKKRDPRDGETALEVAIKKLRLQRIPEAKKKQFQEEVKVLSALSHPAIVQFYGVCIVSPNLAIVMEFLRAGSLYDVLHIESRSLTQSQKSQMIKDMLSALEYLHDKDVAHRDIKSMNIMVCDDLTHCKLADFGLALKEEARSSASMADHTVVGTLKYSPPEVLAGGRLTLPSFKRADVYSLSLVIAELLSEEEPFPGLNQHQARAAILNNERPSMPTAGDGISEEFKDLVRKGMSEQPGLRPTARMMHLYWETLALADEFGPLAISNRSDDPAPQPSIPSPTIVTRERERPTTASSTTSSNTSTTSSRSRNLDCDICTERRKDTALECGHLLCYDCATFILHSGTPHCPQCRTPMRGVSSLRRIYL